MRAPATVLLTGFGPFGEVEVNASWEAVRHLARGWGGTDTLVVRRLPVSFRRAADDLAAAVAEVRPDLVVAVGVAAGRSVISLERVALNLVDARIPDVDGEQPVDVPVVPDAPLAITGRLPVKACLRALEDAGLPAEVSLSAGTYVCNHLYFSLLHQHPDLRAGFVHVPPVPPGTTTGGDERAPAGLPVEDTARALGLVVRTTLATAQDVVVPAGRED